MTPSPPVTVGLPVHNGEALLPGALDSWLAQDLGDFELIVCDNASTDGTEEICREYAVRDTRVRYHREPLNRGAAANFNLAFELAGSPYFTWAAHDDVVEPTFLRRCLELLTEDGGAVLSYPLIDFIDLDGHRVERSEPRLELTDPGPARRLRRLLEADFDVPYPVFGLMRTSAASRTGLIRSNKGSDRTLLAELALMGRFRQVPEVLLHYRSHPPDARERTREWWDPANHARLAVRSLVLLRQHHRAAWSAPIPLPERLRLTVVLANHFLLDNPRLVGDVKATVYQLLDRHGLVPGPLRR